MNLHLNSTKREMDNLVVKPKPESTLPRMKEKNSKHQDQTVTVSLEILVTTNSKIQNHILYSTKPNQNI